ncbi:MAG: hypothetical protein QOI70_214 [Microbacteriaceae bacterium]|nr:hypothetical protein [Microbacteriaceae bacterium]
MILIALIAMGLAVSRVAKRVRRTGPGETGPWAAVLEHDRAMRALAPIDAEDTEEENPSD